MLHHYQQQKTPPGGRKNYKPLSASSSIKSHFHYNGAAYNFSIGGDRPPGLFGEQGDHVTAYGVIKRGIELSLRELNFDSEEGLSQIKRGRSAIYDLISALAALDRKNRGSLYEAVNTILQDYNTKRCKKSVLEKGNNIIERLKAGASIDDDDKEVLSEIISKANDANVQAIKASLEAISATLLTFYNKISGTAYLKIIGYSGLNSGEQRALNFLESPKRDKGLLTLPSVVKLEKQRKKIEELKAKKLAQEKGKTAPRTGALEKNITTEQAALDSLLLLAQQEKEGFILSQTLSSVADLFDYSEITNAQKLDDHVRETKEKLKFAEPVHYRNNDSKDFIEVFSRHIFILRVVFPELAVYTTEELIKESVSKIVTREKGGWPSLRAASTIKDLVRDIITRVEQLEKEQEDFHYTKDGGYQSVKSSPEVSATGSPKRGGGDAEVSSIDEMADELSERLGKLQPPSGGSQQ